jgi:hypothetical protein
MCCRVEIGNEIASASAFPNEIWERGVRQDQWNRLYELAEKGLI